LIAFIKKESRIAGFALPPLNAFIKKESLSTKLQESRRPSVTSNRRKLAQPIHPLRRPLSEAPDKREKTKRERLMESRRPSVT
jgi:hypothetical protein